MGWLFTGVKELFFYNTSTKGCLKDHLTLFFLYCYLVIRKNNYYVNENSSLKEAENRSAVILVYFICQINCGLTMNCCLFLSDCLSDLWSSIWNVVQIITMLWEYRLCTCPLYEQIFIDPPQRPAPQHIEHRPRNMYLTAVVYKQSRRRIRF